MARAGGRRPLRRVRLSRLRRSASLRRPAFFLAFLALGIQNLLVQPHIHAQPAHSLLALEISDQGAGSAGDIPADQTQTDCPICQSANQNGHYLRPSTTSFTAPAFVHDLAHKVVRITATQKAVSHSWQGRAPPQA